MRDGSVPFSFHVLGKPTGAVCNLDCNYCFYLSKEMLYPGSRFRMADELLEAYIAQLIGAQGGNHVSVAWQGGEPTLMGVEFFRRSIGYQQKYKRPGVVVENTLQTNGTLLDDEWCAFFREHAFLIGLSLDGPREMHDAYRVDKRGRGTFDSVMRGVRLLQKHGVEFNVLTTVHKKNADHPLDVYRFLRDEVKTQFIQLIPIVERERDASGTERGPVTERSVGPEQYGRFLIAIFDEWVRRDVGEVFVQLFDTALAAWLRLPSPMCIFSETCGRALALEHTGDLYSCDHFVEPQHLLGNIKKKSLREMVLSEQQLRFGNQKRDGLPRYCRECRVRFACQGECPKNRFVDTPDGEPGLNYLCAGYKQYFAHIDRPMQMMARLLRRGRTADEVMQMLAAEEAPISSGGQSA
jgi:uncharacterized protein